MRRTRSPCGESVAVDRQRCTLGALRWVGCPPFPADRPAPRWLHFGMLASTSTPKTNNPSASPIRNEWLGQQMKENLAQLMSAQPARGAAILREITGPILVSPACVPWLRRPDLVTGSQLTSPPPGALWQTPRAPEPRSRRSRDSERRSWCLYGRHPSTSGMATPWFACTIRRARPSQGLPASCRVT